MKIQKYIYGTKKTRKTEMKKERKKERQEKCDPTVSIEIEEEEGSKKTTNLQSTPIEIKRNMKCENNKISKVHL